MDMTNTGLATRSLIVGGVALVLSGCVSEPRVEQQVAEAIETQPRVATYDCGSAGPVTVENNRTFVRLSGGNGESVELAAVPESGGARYATDGTAIVLEGSDMLLMSGRNEPVDCRR